MRKTKLLSTVAMALLLGAGAVSAQGMGKERTSVPGIAGTGRMRVRVTPDIFLAWSADTTLAGG